MSHAKVGSDPFKTVAVYTEQRNRQTHWHTDLILYKIYKIRSSHWYAYVRNSVNAFKASSVLILKVVPAVCFEPSTKTRQSSEIRRWQALYLAEPGRLGTLLRDWKHALFTETRINYRLSTDWRLQWVMNRSTTRTTADCGSRECRASEHTSNWTRLLATSRAPRGAHHASCRSMKIVCPRLVAGCFVNRFEII